jgi:hypothetical protein
MTLLSYDETTHTGQLALSVVLSNYTDSDWVSSFNDTVVAGDALQGYTASVTPGSGILVAAIPEPITFVIWGLLGSVAIAYGVSRRRRAG